MSLLTKLFLLSISVYVCIFLIYVYRSSDATILKFFEISLNLVGNYKQKKSNLTMMILIYQNEDDFVFRWKIMAMSIVKLSKRR